MYRRTILLTFLMTAVCAAAQKDDVSREDTLREVTITSRKAINRIQEVQIGVEKIDVSSLVSVPALFGEKDIIKSIQLLPGVKSESDGSGGYQVRGGTSSQNLMLLDDATIYNAGHLMGLFSTFNDVALGNASLYKGLVPAQFGGATSSVFDIDTRPGDMQHYHFSGTVGLLSAKVAAEGPIQRDRSSFLFAGRRSYLDIFLKATKDYKDNTMNFYDTNLRLNFRLSPSDILNVSFFRGRDNMGLEDLIDMTWGNTTATANWLHTFRDGFYANTELVYSDFNSDVGVDMMNIYYNMAGHIRHLTFHHHQELTPVKQHRLNYGVETTYLGLQSAEWDLQMLHQREKRNAWMNNVWVNDEWHLSPAIDLSAGLRLHLFTVLGGAPYYQIDANGNIISTEYPSSGTFVKTHTSLEPRVSMKWAINDRHSLKIGYSRTTQDIHAIRGSSSSMPFDRYTMTSNIVKPEQAHQVAAGWTAITHDGMYDMSLEGYFKSIDNVYDYRNGKTFHSEIEMERLILGGKGRSYGVELCAHKNEGRFTGWLSYTLSWSENKIEGINGGAWYTATNDRRHDVVIVGMYKLNDRWNLSATWRYNTGQALTAPSAKFEVDGHTYYYYAERSGYRAPAYHRLDVGATYTRKTRRTTQEWAFGVFNAYNRYNPYVILFKNDPESPTGTKTMQTSLFGVIPSVSFTIRY